MINTQPVLFKPSRSYIEQVRVGSLVPNCFGKLAEVTEIYARKDDIHGKLFVCFYTKMSEGATVSGSLKEGELFRSVATSYWGTSAQLDEIEKNIPEMDVYPCALEGAQNMLQS